MEYVFTILVAILLVLIVAVFELRKLNALLKERLNTPLGQIENRETSPTINVNLGTMAMADDRPKRLKKTEAIEESNPPEISAVAEPSPAAEEPPPAPPPPKFNYTPPRPAGNGLSIVKCPNCSAENSGFRTECFSCGARL